MLIKFFNLFNRIFKPLLKTCFSLNEINFKFKNPSINNIDIPLFQKSFINNKEITINKPNIIELSTKALSDIIEINSHNTIIQKPKIYGKIYNKPQDQSQTKKETQMFDDIDGEQICIHRLKKRFCGYCIDNEKQRIKSQTTTLAHEDDIFNFIFPYLQPPLGENFDNPIAFPSELYPFQREGIKFLLDNDIALLADEMGLGKSIQSITALRVLFRRGDICNALVLSPKSVLTDWYKKFEDWSPELRVIIIRGSKAERQVTWNMPGHIYLTTYETFRQDLGKTLNISEEEDIAKKAFDIVILDEIQKIKNPSADITKAARKITSKKRWGLSGTPLENRTDDLISIFAFLQPNLLHYSDADFHLEIKNKIEPYTLRRRKKDVLEDLPPKNCSEVWLELTPKQRDTYENLERTGIKELNDKGDMITIKHILALITNLKQICNLEPATKESCKVDFLIEKLEEIIDDESKALIFSQYPEKTLSFVKPMLKKYNPEIYSGILSDKRRDEIVNEFQTKPDCKTLLMSVKAGGLGLTLTKANYVFHFDLWWNPAVAAQAEDRAHRIGQKKTVYVTTLFTKDTIEERIQNLLNKKRKLFDEIIDDLSDTNLANVLTEEDLYELFNLKKSKRTYEKDTKKRIFTPEKLSSITSEKFEELILQLYKKMNYDIKCYKKRKNGDIYFWAIKNIQENFEINPVLCIHRPNCNLDIKDLNQLNKTSFDEEDSLRGRFLTTSNISEKVKRYIIRKKYRVYEINELCDLFENNNLNEI